MELFTKNLPHIFLILGTDMAGKDHVANVVMDAAQAADGHTGVGGEPHGHSPVGLCPGPSAYPHRGHPHSNEHSPVVSDHGAPNLRCGLATAGFSLHTKPILFHSTFFLLPFSPTFFKSYHERQSPSLEKLATWFTFKRRTDAHEHGVFSPAPCRHHKQVSLQP